MLKSAIHKLSICLYSLMLFGLFNSPAQADVPESGDPIKIVTMGYVGDEIIVYIYGGLLKKLGYNIEYVPTDYLGQFEDLQSGKVHIGSPGWDTTAKKSMKDAWDTGNVLNMGHMNIRANEDWWYPKYLENYCPGLPDWRALLETECAKALSNNQSDGQAVFVSGPVAWGGHDAERVDALSLNMKVVHADNDQTLLDIIAKAAKQKRPILALMWEPFWLPAFYPGEFVEWPEYEDACYEDPSWGVNKEKTHDCGRPNGYLWKTAWAGGEAKWPKAYDVYRKLALDNQTMGELVYKADVEGLGALKAAEGWLKKNEVIWQEWIK